MGPISAPWTAALSQGAHDLVLLGLVATGLVLLSTLVRVRFTSGESHGTFRAASLTANAVVAIALVSYVALVLAFLLGYRAVEHGAAVVYEPTPVARYAWAFRYMDWIVTVPLLVVELCAISAMSAVALRRIRSIGAASAVAMVGAGFLGAFVVGSGRTPVGYVLFGVGGALCFAVLYGLFFAMMLRSLPRLPESARSSYRAAIVLLLLTWLAYPVVYGFSGVVFGEAAAVAGQLILCAADLVAKVGFGTLVHRTAVLRSRSDEELDPSPVRRPRQPTNDSVYVAAGRSLGQDD